MRYLSGVRSVEPVRPGASEDERAEDSARLASITRYDVVGRPPGEALQGLARLAASVTGMPLSAIDLVTDREQYQLATVGFTADVCAREDSLCDVVLQEPGAVVVEDMAVDPRFAGNPYVDGARAAIRFYASQQLVTARGVVIGRLCVFDTEPREIDQARLDDLRTVADSVVDVLELSLRNRELDGSNERLGTFASRVSHDLKTPLTSISMTLQLLRDEMDHEGRSPADAQETRWLLDKSIAASERLAHMVDSVLSHATIDGQLDRTNVDLQRLVAEVLDELRVELGDASVEVEPLPTVLGDAVHLRTLLQNLVSNAARYRHTDRPLLVRIQAEQRGLMQHVTITDNGIGIPREEQHRIFQRGVRGVADGGEGGGAGIGLEICRRVVEAHAGTIGVVSDGERGTTVWFELPV